MAKLTKREREAMRHPNVLGAGARKRRKLSPKSKKKVVMAEFRRGTLHSGSGEIVKDPQQAIAIAYSEARRRRRAMRRRRRKRR